MNFKKILIVIISLLAYGVSWAGGIQDQHKRYLARVNASGGGVTCSGDMSDGDNESFEKGAGEFCTTDWTEVDVDGVVDTYDTTYANTGTHSMSVICDDDSPNANSNRAYVDTGTLDNDVRIRFYIWLPALPSGAYTRVFKVNRLNSSSYVVFLQWYNSYGTYKYNIRGTGNDPEYFNLSVDTKYRVELHVVKGATSTLKIFDASGDPVATSNGGVDYEQSDTAVNVDIGDFTFDDETSTATASIYYVADVVIDLDGSGDIGPE